MSQVIMITSGKGGVGKSTVCANLGMKLALDGYKVCMIDADIGLKNLDIMMGLENRIMYDMNDVIQGICSIEKAMIRDKHCRNLFLLPSCKTMQIERVSGQDMQLVVKELKQIFDYILIDSPAGIETGFHHALSCSSMAIVVVQLEITSLHDADRVIGLLHRHGLKEIKLVINRVNPELIRKQVQLRIEDAVEWLSIDLLGLVYEDEKIALSISKGNIRSMEPSTLTHACFTTMVKRLNHELADIPKFKEKNLWQRMFS